MANITSFSSKDMHKLPKQTCWESFDLYNLQGFWYNELLLKGVFGVQSQFQARPDDVVLASFPKTDTTWLKALSTSLLHTQNDSNDDQLSTKNPHAIVRTLEYDLFKDENTPPDLDLSTLPSPRLFHSHMAYSHLPDTVKAFDCCKIVYITRNPYDVVVSNWHFFNSEPWRGSDREAYPIEKVLDEFCNGLQICGPYFDHVLEFWHESLRRPEKVLFLKYEDVKRDPRGEVKRLGLFLGRQFENDEEVDEVVWRASIDRLKDLEVNKNGVVFDLEVPTSTFEK